MKTLIAIRNVGGRGKSASALEFANHLLTTFPVYTKIKMTPDPISGLKQGVDFSLIVEVPTAFGNKIIGVESQGDPGYNLKDRLSKLVIANCDIIVCTCRTSGETYEDVARLSPQYQIIWTSTYNCSDQIQQPILNVIKGLHIYDLLKQLSLV